MFSPMTHLSSNPNWTLADLSDEKSKQLTPSIVYIAFLMVMGVLGNALVLVVFYLRFQPSTHRCFILVLAFFDFVACAVGAPLVIVDMLNIYTFYFEIPCKLFRFTLYYPSIASSLTLVLIACERYRKICKPLDAQMTVFMAKRALVLVAGVFSFVSSIPPLILFGNSTIETGVGNLTGIGCFLTDKYNHTIYPTIYNGYLLFLGVTSTIIMAVCYICIARQIKRMGKMKKSLKGGKYGCKPISSSEKSEDDLESEVSSREGSQEYCNSITELNSMSVGNRNSVHQDSQRDSQRDSQGRNVKKKASRWAGKVIRHLSGRSSRKTVRTTKMLTIVTVAFVISYLPHLVLMIVNMVTGGENLPEDNFYQILFTSFLLNNIANPFIYAAMDKKFKRESKNLITAPVPSSWRTADRCFDCGHPL